MLLTGDQVAPLSPKQPWQVTGTSDNTDGDGKNTMCQTARFADTRGLGTWVRKFVVPRPRAASCQTVEISNSPGAAVKAYATTLGWYAGCTVARIQLVDAYDVQGVGERPRCCGCGSPDQQPRVVPDRHRPHRCADDLGPCWRPPKAPPPDPSAAGDRPDRVGAEPVRLEGRRRVRRRGRHPCGPAAAERRDPGHAGDRRPPGDRRRAGAWVGTDPAPARLNVAATTCDQADFAECRRDGPGHPHLPDPRGAAAPAVRAHRDDSARSPTAKGATAFVTRIAAADEGLPDSVTSAARSAMPSCTSTGHQEHGASGPSYALWRLENQVNKNAGPGAVLDGRRPGRPARRPGQPDAGRASTTSTGGPSRRWSSGPGTDCTR